MILFPPVLRLFIGTGLKLTTGLKLLIILEFGLYVAGLWVGLPSLWFLGLGARFAF